MFAPVYRNLMFISYFVEYSTCYITSEEGEKYFPVFAAIRWHHVINDITGIKMIENDKVIPMSKFLFTMF